VGKASARVTDADRDAFRDLVEGMNDADLCAGALRGQEVASLAYGVAKLRLPMPPRVRAMAESVLRERSEELGTTVLHQLTWSLGEEDKRAASPDPQ
jgi:hypothetical protein